MKTVWMSLVALTISANFSMAMEHKMPPVKMPKEFDTMKKLIGTWEGKNEMHGKEEMVTVEYKLTSGGTAIMETLMPGSAHEMVSMYYKNGNKLAMTHYCAIGNQPQMVLTKADPKAYTFEMTKTAGVSSMKEMHMHALTLKFTNDDELTQEWTNFMDGKRGETAVFNLKRKK